jgi:hypothetical protein
MIMAKLFCVSTVLTAAAANAPKWLNPAFVEAFVEGVLDEHSDLMDCTIAVLTPAEDAQTTVKDAKKAIQDRNATEFLHIFEDLESFFHDFEHVVDSCSPLKADLLFDWSGLRNITSVKSLRQRVSSNLLNDDRDLILAELEAAVQAHAKGYDSTMGRQLGMAVHRLIISPAYPGDMRSQKPLPGKVSPIFMEAFVEALLDEHFDLMDCTIAIMTPAEDAVNAKKDIQARNTTLVEHDLEKLFQDLSAVKPGCSPVIADASFDWSVLKSIKSIKDAKEHVKQNFLGDDKDLILAELEAAWQAHKRGFDSTYGQELGWALHRLLIAPFPAAAAAVLV